jgi:hypothetical protein
VRNPAESPWGSRQSEVDLTEGGSLMAIKKSELYSSLWRSCDELRGGMDASQYKDYVLVLLFMKYVSDKKTLLDIPKGGSFADMVAIKGDKAIGEKMFCSARTVESYRDSLFEKLGLKTRIGLVLYAIKHKIVELD